MVKKLRYIFPIILFFYVISVAQQKATTTNGKKVILNQDGTWKSAPNKSSTTFHPTTISHLELPKANPNDQIITHTGYTLSFNKTYHIASWVAYELTAEETVAKVQRNNHFKPDPLLTTCTISNADYKDSGYDKGHLAPSADMCYSYETMIESFYLSNMSPQNPSFNRGIWKKLEEQVRQWAVDDKAVYVVTGTVLTRGLSTIGADRITVPAYFYKVILDYTEPDIKGIAFLIPNEGSQEPLQHYAVTIDSVEKVTGTDFFYQLPEDQEKVIESTVDISKWSWTATKTHSLKKDRSSQSVQCSGLTKAGNQCKNMTLNPNGYCHVHQNQTNGGVLEIKVAQNKSIKRTILVRHSATIQKRMQKSNRN